MLKNHFVKRVHVFFSSVLLFLLHLPFVFAKVHTEQTTPENQSVKMPAAEDFTATGEMSFNDKNVISANRIYDSLKLASIGLTKQVFDCAMKGFEYLKEKGSFSNENIISIADLSKSSCKKRLFVIDLKNYKVLFNTYVAHGMNSGQEFARQFSNTPESNKTSLGFYETAGTYNGKHGYSLHLLGMEKGINDNAFSRDIVIHAADYVNENFINTKGYLGRSQGCPALPEKQHKQIIDKIKNGTCLFIFGEDRNYFRRSALLNNTVPLLAYK